MAVAEDNPRIVKLNCYTRLVPVEAAIGRWKKFDSSTGMKKNKPDSSYVDSGGLREYSLKISRQRNH
ncbi:unnamed protein product [Leptosia nina]|uniref:Uncharacterized protein n=1 Tax=Leptosia nina TaxID=320188 RepID=A0AAV1JX26_9NEOP